METLLNPLSALIGGGLGIIGGLMNSSSSQAINAANLQSQMWSAEGGYLPGLVQNANKAGLNPLAVLGSRGPNMAVQVGTQPGAGVEAAGRSIAQMQDPEVHDLQVQNAREDLAQRTTTNKNLMIDNAVKMITLRGLEEGKYVPPGVSEPAKDTGLQGAAVDFMRTRKLSDFTPKFPTFDTTPWSWMDFSKRLWTDQGQFQPYYGR